MMTSQIPAFFVPGAESGHHEKALEALATFVNEPLPARGRRVYSITFLQDDESWTATVGQPFPGPKAGPGGGDKTLARYQRFEQDPATILAIFPGAPYVVVTDGRITSHFQSEWNNPFLVDEPTRVIYFAA